MGVNIYKPRYKIAFLAKTKVWIYKESRLRRFFNIRGRKLVRRGLFKRRVLVQNNMKWTVARRYIRPYMRRRKSVKKNYKHKFYNKQQLRHFYGKFKEEAFRTLFKAHLTGVYSRNNSFYSSLERRIDMFLFRTRYFPTLYSASQFVHHQGVEYDGIIAKSPGSLVGPGTCLLFDPYHWELFAETIYTRIFYRRFGNKLLKKRKLFRFWKLVRKLLPYIRRKRNLSRYISPRILESKQSKKFILYSKLLRKLYNLQKYLPKLITSFEKKKLNIWIKLLSTKIEKKEDNIKLKIKLHVESMQKELREIEDLLNKSKKIKIPFKKHKLKNKKREIYFFNALKLTLSLYVRISNLFLFEKKLSFENSFTILKVSLLKSFNRFRTIEQSVNETLNKKILQKKKLESLDLQLKRLPNNFSGVFDFKTLWLLILWNFFKNSPFEEQFLSIQKTILFELWNTFLKNEKEFDEKLNKKKYQIKILRKSLIENNSKVFRLKNIFKRTEFELKSKVSLFHKLLDQNTELSDTVSRLKDKNVSLISSLIEDLKIKLPYRRWKAKNRKIRLHKKTNILLENLKKNATAEQEKKSKKKYQEKVKRRMGLYYFFLYHRKKRKKRKKSPRLRRVHWYIPSYVHFNFISLETTMIHAPLPKEIYFSFKGSLSKLHAFYRSRGI